jgi:hypothetical protein
MVIAEVNRVAALRREVDLAQFAIPQSCRSRWANALTSVMMDDLGTLALLGPTGLRVRGARDRLSPDPMTLSIAALVSSRIGTGARLALGLPPGARHLPLMIAATAILGDAMRRAAPRGMHPPSKGMSGVLIVSSDLDVRSRYCDLYVKNESLDTVYPGSRLRPTGDQFSLNSGAATFADTGVCFLLPGQVLPATTLKPGLVILDLRYARHVRRAHDYCVWASRLHPKSEVLALYTLGDRDTGSALAKLKFTDISLDHVAIGEVAAACSNGRPATGSLRIGVLPSSDFLQRSHELIVARDEATERLLSTARQIISAEKRSDDLGLNRARWILATLAQMPVPIAWYEKTARDLGRSTLRRLIDRLTIAHAPGMGAMMQSLKMQFDLLWHHLSERERNGRAERLVEILPNLAANVDELLLLVRDRVMQRALQSWLDIEIFSGEPWMSKLDIHACRDYESIADARYPLVLINGALPRRYRWIGGAALGREVKFLIYSSEADAVSYQLDEFYGEGAIKARAAQREQELCGSFRSDSAPVKIPQLILAKPPIPRVQSAPVREKPKVVIGNLRELDSAIDAAKELAKKAQARAHEAEKLRSIAWDETTDDETPEDAVQSGPDEPHQDDVDAIDVRVNSGLHGPAMLWLAIDQTVEVVSKQNPDQLSRLLPTEVEPGDIVILLESEARGALFDRVVGLVEDQPDLHHLRAFRKKWQEAMRVMAQKYELPRQSFGRVLADLQSAGSTITTALSVQNWVLGRVMGPDDVSSIQAVGEVTGIQPLVQHAAEFDRAFRTIRSIHQALGKRLSRAIHHSAKALIESDTGSEFDAFGDYVSLPVNELLETVDLAEITSVGNSSRVAAYRIGKLIHNA